MEVEVEVRENEILIKQWQFSFFASGLPDGIDLEQPRDGKGGRKR
jgi:hypothetical protein